MFLATTKAAARKDVKDTSTEPSSEDGAATAVASPAAADRWRWRQRRKVGVHANVRQICLHTKANVHKGAKISAVPTLRAVWTSGDMCGAGYRVNYIIIISLHY